MKPMSLPRSPERRDKHFSALRIENITKSFMAGGKTLPVLADISLSAKKGQVISILGKSGCGKSTLLNLATKLERPDSGKIVVNGSIGYLPQGETLLPWRTVMENILLPIEIQGGNIEVSLLKGKKMLLEAGLDSFKHAYPDVLSGGMKQRVCLIRTMLQDPDILLLDEPFSAIDFDSRMQLGQAVRDYVLANKKIAILVTHNIDEAISLADRFMIMRGRPAHITHEEEINIPEKDRNPLVIKGNSEYHHLFKTAWHNLKDSL